MSKTDSVEVSSMPVVCVGFPYPWIIEKLPHQVISHWLSTWARITTNHDCLLNVSFSMLPAGGIPLRLKPVHKGLWGCALHQVLWPTLTDS